MTREQAIDEAVRKAFAPYIRPAFDEVVSHPYGILGSITIRQVRVEFRRLMAEHT